MDGTGRARMVIRARTLFQEPVKHNGFNGSGRRAGAAVRFTEYAVSHLAIALSTLHKNRGGGGRGVDSLRHVFVTL